MEHKETHHSNNEITVIWQPTLCQHSGICVRMLPKVYHPGQVPWIKIDEAKTPELIEQVGKCPSGALSYKKK